MDSNGTLENNLLSTKNSVPLIFSIKM